MKVVSVKQKISNNPVNVLDMYVDSGYLQGESGSLPDVDVDFQSDRRQDVKKYIETRYNHDGKQRVFSAGTFTTLKIKAAITDVSRIYRVPVSTVKYITKIFDDDKMTWTDLFKMAAVNPRVKGFIMDFPQVIEDIRTLMNSPRSSSIHASALLVTPDYRNGKDMECFDYTPIKKIDGVLISEFDGGSLDDQGLLKNDVLATKELSKLQSIMKICNSTYNAGVSLEGLVTGNMDDPKTYELLKDGFTNDVFQFTGNGITKFLIDLKPENINDLTAANALYRPATLTFGSAQKYVDCKLGDDTPVYLWGTHEALKDTYGVMCYQEDLARIAREVGGFSLGEGVKLVKFISKKKVDKIMAMKDKFMKGAKNNKCPQEDADKIWEMMEAGGSYLFNKSHATAYSSMAYVSAYLKAHYPLAFYTVALQWANKENIPTLISEMEICSDAKIVPPDINNAEKDFHTDYKLNEIFWSFSRIDKVGVKTIEFIISEREKRGEFTSLENFLERIFKYKLKKTEYYDDPNDSGESEKCPVNTLHVKNLILAGCFDNIEHVLSVVERYDLLNRASDILKFEIKDADFPEEAIQKHYFWSQKQIAVSGLGSIDYKRIYDGMEIKNKLKTRAGWVTLEMALEDRYDGKKGIILSSIADIEEKKYIDKKSGEAKDYCKILLQQNNTIAELVIWNDEWMQVRSMFNRSGKISDVKNKMMVGVFNIRFSEFSRKNTLQFAKNSLVEIV